MLKNKFSIVILLTVCILSIILTGCWDKVEIDERAFALGVGVDLNDPESEDPIKASFIIPSPAFIRGEGEVANIVLMSPGVSLISIMRRMNMRASVSLYLGHLRVILLGEDLVKDENILREIFDALEKDPHISRKVNIAVVEGKAEDVVKIEPEIEPNITEYIRRMFQLAHRTNRAPLEDLDSIFYQFHKNGNGIITRIIPGESDVKVAGAAVFKHFQFVDFIGEEVNRGLMFLRDKAKSGGYNVKFEGITTPIEITDTKTKYSLVRNNDDFRIIVEVDLEGDIRQHYFNPEVRVLDPEKIEELQAALASSVKANMQHSLNVFQKELQVDVIGFDDYIHRYHPKLWNEIRDEYEEIFPQMDVVINVDASIRRVGLSK